MTDRLDELSVGQREIQALTVTKTDDRMTVDEFHQRIACTPVLLGTADLKRIRTEVHFSFDNREATYVVVGWDREALVMEKTNEWVWCDKCKGRIMPLEVEAHERKWHGR